MTDAEPAPARPSWRDEPVQRRLRVRQLVMIGIGLVVLALAIVDLVDGVIGPVGAVSGFVGGAVVGLIGLRISRIGWDAGTARVVARADRIGLVILVALLVARLSRDWLLEHWVTGARLTALGLSSPPEPSSSGWSAPAAPSSPRCPTAPVRRSSRPHDVPHRRRLEVAR